jgi:hypothetical protein
MSKKRSRRRQLSPLGRTPAIRIVPIIANYHLEHPGKWSAELFHAESAGTPDPQVLIWVGLFDTPRAVFDAVIRAVEELVDQDDVAVSTIHALAGDPEAWMSLVE